MRQTTATRGSELANPAPPAQRRTDATGRAVRYTLHLPLARNDGTPIATEEIAEVGTMIARYAGGCTQLAPGNGWWVAPDGARYIDPIVPLEAIAPATPASDAFFLSLARQLAARFDQGAIFLHVAAVTFVGAIPAIGGPISGPGPSRTEERGQISGPRPRVADR